ncbi:hypothetical protein ACFP9V_02580 [Deinococcus radiopugnans]
MTVVRGAGVRTVKARAQGGFWARLFRHNRLARVGAVLVSFFS